jgi:carboxylesterase
VETQDQISRLKTGLLLFHHSGSNPTPLNILASEIGRIGLAVRCPQLADHDASRHVLARYRSCEQALADIARNCDRVIVGGFGFGGLIGLRLSAENPDKVHGIVALSPTLWCKVPAVKKLPIVCIALLAKIRAEFGFLFARARDDRALRKTDTGEPISVSECLAKEHRQFAIELIKKLKSVHQPTLIIQSRTDNHADLKSAEYLQRHLGGPVQVTVLDRGYHDGAVDCPADVITEKVLAFVASVERPPALAEVLQFPTKSTKIYERSRGRGT